MENCTTLITTLLISSASLVLYGLMRVVYVVWWRPKSLEKQLRQQGIQGTSFNLLQFHGGDMRKMVKVSKETWSKPMSLNHHIAPYVLPSFHQMVQKIPNLAGDVIARTAFGSCFEEGKMIFELQKEQLVLVLEAFQSIYFPGLRFIPTKKNRRRYNIDKVIRETLQDMIRKKEQAMQVNGEFGNNDLLDLLLQDHSQLAHLDNDCLVHAYKLARKAREEVLRTCGNKVPNVENLNSLKIVSMILNEVLRLYPPVTVQQRHTIKKTTIGGMSIPSGVDIWLPTLFFHHDPEYWGDDAGEFKPERFAQGVSKATKDQQNAFYPFGWGPRFCLGQNFAMIEAKMALAMILQTFSFELSPSYTHSPFTLITLQPQHGAPIILHQL
ncbi:hypothetical protein LWI29_013823 [Acer saccharum]|uniref:Cytochrome P450 n=1 Tax=Acer saccharum TaxID=4024 RepID=A0AA39V8F8_ACESA|nr:hypothetical protein LWI29_013823 [Acer saccharum]